MVVSIAVWAFLVMAIVFQMLVISQVKEIQLELRQLRRALKVPEEEPWVG